MSYDEQYQHESCAACRAYEQERVEQQAEIERLRGDNERLHHEISYYESLVEQTDETDWPHRDGRYRDWLRTKLKETEQLRSLLREVIQDPERVTIGDVKHWELIVTDEWYKRAKEAGYG